MSHHSLPLKTFAAGVALTAEAALAAFHWLVLWIGVFVMAVLFGFAPQVLSIVFWIGCFILAVRGLRRFHFPNKTEIAARLERHSGLRHRPLRGRDDEPATPMTRHGEALWERERTRKFRDLALLRWILPVFNMTRRDPYALRIGLLLGLIVAFIFSGPNAADKIGTALFPFIPQEQVETVSDIQLIVTSPPYTRRPQIVISGTLADPVEIAEGSTVRALVQSKIGHLTLKLGDNALPLTQSGETNSYSAETKVRETDTIRLTQFGLTRLSVPVRFLADQAPSVTMRTTPEPMPGGQIRLNLSVQDDYGLKTVRLRAQLKPEVSPAPWGEPIYEEQGLMTGGGTSPADISPKFDLSGHPWAGYPVSLLIEVEDHAGHTAMAGPVDFVLPQRMLRHPVAREIAAARKTLIDGKERGIDASILQIVEILARPGRYDWDGVVTLALRSSLSRLGYAPDVTSAQSVIATLWQTALRLEDGNLSSTQTDMRKALEDLQKALNEKAPPEEIARLMQEFREALLNHLVATQREMQKRAAAGEAMLLDPGVITRTLDPAALDDFLNQLQSEMANGDIDAAMKKLESLQKLSELLDPSMTQPLPQDVKDTMKDIQDLQKLIDRQQSLLDATRAKKDKNAASEKQAQDKLGEDLGQMRGKAGQAGRKPPENLGQAEDAMGQSSGRLGSNDPQGSLPHQQQALDHLRQGKQQMQQALQQKLQQMTGLSIGQNPGGSDPLGRANSGNGRDPLSGEDVKIPTASERKKADEILKVIRERSGDLTRPQAEREYYQRLLRQW